MQAASIDIYETVQRHYGSMSATLQSQARIALTAYSEALGDLSAMVEAWMFDDELSPATCRKRLNCLSKMGYDVTGHRPKLSKAPKWWLTPQDREAIMGSAKVPQVLKLYIKWVTMTGLRVEENLRLEPSMLLGVGVPDRVMIPGTKTALAAATLPISKDAGEVISEAMRLSGGAPFPGSYREWVTMWDNARAAIGASDEPTATLKALRRNAARYLHVDRGMPLDIVRQYLRHAHIDTTLGYLKLTGGYGEEEMRRYL